MSTDMAPGLDTLTFLMFLGWYVRGVQSRNHFLFNSNSHAHSSEREGSKNGCPSGYEPGSPGLQFAVYLWHATRVSQSGQCFRVHVIPASVTLSDLAHFLHFPLFDFAGNGKGGFQKMGFPPGYEPGIDRTTMHCPPMARQSDVAARAAISWSIWYPLLWRNRRIFFTSLVGFCWTVYG